MPIPKKRVTSVCLDTGVDLITFESLKEAEKHYGINRRTIYNHASGRTKKPFKFGAIPKHRIFFKWA